MKTKKLLYLFFANLNPVDRERFGVNYFEQRGYQVECLICAPLFDPSLAAKIPFEPQPGTARVESLAQFDQILAKQPEGTVIIDFFKGVSLMGGGFMKAYKLIKKHQIPFVVISSAPVPLGGLPSSAKSGAKLGRLLDKLQAATPKSLLHALSIRWTRWLRRFHDPFPQPLWVFSQNNPQLQRFLDDSHVGRDRLVPIHSVEYDRLIQMRRQGLDQPPLENWCVFIDDLSTSHPDAQILDDPLIEPGYYFRQMGLFFDHLEAKTGLQVVIAAHPKADYSQHNPWPRPVLQESTPNLVARSQMVALHHSTAISFAVLYHKPILLTRFAAMIPHAFYLGEFLGLPVIPLDDAKAWQDLDFAQCAKPTPRYQDYRDTYLTTPGSQDRLTWEVVEERLQIAWETDQPQSSET